MSSSDLAGKNVVVTGPTSGIGKGTALALAADGARTILVARNPAKCEAVAQKIRGAGGPAPISIIADLSLLSDAKRAADEILALDLPIDILVNNAGLVNKTRRLTSEGLEETMAVNYFAPFAMSLKLLPALRRAERARIINVTSNSYAIARLDFDDLTFERRYWMLGPYSVSKLGNIYFTRELARRLEGTKITVNAAHPGLIFTNLGLGNNSHFAKKVIGSVWGFFAKDESEGHTCVVWAATSPELEGVTGKYLADCKVTKPKKIARRDAAARRLWDISESTTGVRWEVDQWP